jgi:tRNA(Arg) A34 adenosine deaminase TadA
MEKENDIRTRSFAAAIAEADAGWRAGEGGPFGAAVIRGGEIIAVAHNTVLRDCDPTRHAEMNALSSAGRALASPHLAGCVLVASSEPCPMCLAAAYWARVDAVWFAASAEVAAKFGFADVDFYDELAKPPEQRRLRVFRPADAPTVGVEAVFRAWKEANGKLY